ncbi:MAG: 16S rRNA (cytosine(967)-C(5))-methyltransferase RsmB [Bacteroidota bacterium]|nr:16S rRNA (cytosine(967)-C(5))-methyltransferase RsmB [Candidatus Kapabacteria bacterium]MDW8220205.1 16S rRNA (cytosine(967)-C(5))-methyltransferase RsmB [Bacteroidota bacterium]
MSTSSSSGNSGNQPPHRQQLSHAHTHQHTKRHHDKRKHKHQKQSAHRNLSAPQNPELYTSEHTTLHGTSTTATIADIQTHTIEQKPESAFAQEEIPYTPEFVPTHSGIESPEQLQELHQNATPVPVQDKELPYVPDAPARGSDNIFYSDFHPLFTTARGLAIKILSRLDQSDSYLDKLLEYELAHCDLKPVDKALLTELVHGVTRWQARLDWILTGFYHGEFVKCIVPVKNAMRIALYQIMFLQRIPPFAAVNESVEFIKRLKGNRSGNLVNAILRNILNNLNNIRYPARDEDVARHFAIFYSHPFWMVKRWIDRYGEESTEALLRTNNERPKIAIRLNPLRCNPDALIEFLDQQGIKHWNAPFETERFILVGSLSSVREWQPFRDGWFSVQDVSAALAVRLAQVQPGYRVYDVCAAPGGKTTFLAELMHDEGSIIALDKYPGKLKAIRDSAERLGLRSITTLAHDVRTFTPDHLADVVLVDAPCSGLGTLAKKPDIKWKIELAHIAPLARTQREILVHAAALVKVGGALVYSTCTIEPEENIEQVHWFLEQFPNYELDRAEQYLPDAVCAQGCLQTMPHKHRTDGAFAARFIRIS